MGGDDLGSDDEYLLDTTTTAPNSSSLVSFSVEDEAGEAVGRAVGRAVGTAVGEGVGKRKQFESNSKEEEDADVTLQSNKKIKLNNKNVLIVAGRGIATSDVHSQAKFFATCYSHAIRQRLSFQDKNLSNDNNNNNKTNHNNSNNNKQNDEENNNDEEEEEEEDIFEFQPHHFQNIAIIYQNHDNLHSFLKHISINPSNSSSNKSNSKRKLSINQIKKWPHPRSPMILILTLSARRAVQLLKQLQPLKTKVAKLFGKHVSVRDQLQMLGGGGSSGNNGGNMKYCGIAVGTPGRLLTLLRHPDNDLALRLNRTRLVVLDCHSDAKGFNVCTLKDTRVDLMDFVREGVVPMLHAKQGSHLKLAMF